MEKNKILNELNGKNIMSTTIVLLQQLISENYQFPEVEPDECVRTTEGDIQFD